MTFRLSPLQRKDLAEKLLKWLQENGVASCASTSNLLDRAAQELDEQKFHLWRAYELLRMMGRVELNNPNGRKGFRVLDYTPLAVYQLKTDGFKETVETAMLAQTLKDLKTRYPKIWAAALDQLANK